MAGNPPDPPTTMLLRRIPLLCLLVCGITFPWASHVESSDDLFSERIAPILQQRCLSCHHDGDPKGGVSFSNPRDLLDSGYADTEDVDASYLMELITPVDGKAAMPKDAAPLQPEEIAAVRRWIAGGAEWPEGTTLEPPAVTDLDWWSLSPIAGNELPADSEAAHPIDRFVEAELVERGLSPVEPADPLTLIRRLTYDLTGLPPTPAEIDAFLEAWRQDEEHAWTAAVDRLLDSPAFGEKFAQHWLDVARYAETHGYDKDKPRDNAWPYRDYVVRSFNGDKPYSRFVQEQIAGDALFPGDPDGVLGLGFLAAGPWDFIGHWEVGEGKLDGRIAKHLDRDEMVSAVFNVFMSTTVQCAQCHHHKFDPIRMEDYYRLHAVFAAVDRADRVYDGLPPKQQRRKRELDSRIGELKAEKQTLTAELNRLIAAKAAGIDRRIAELKEKFGTRESPQPQYGYHSQITRNPNEVKWVQLDLGGHRTVDAIRIMPAYDQYNNIGGGFGFPVRYRVEAAEDADFTRGVRSLLDATGEDQPNPNTQTIVVPGDGQPIRFLRITATKLRERRNDFIFALGEIEVVGEAGAGNFAEQATLTAKDSIEQGVRWGKANLIDGVYYRQWTDPDAASEASSLRIQREAIEQSVRRAGTDQRLAEIAKRLEELTGELKRIPVGRKVYAAATQFSGGGRFTATDGTPRPIHLLHRGDLRSPGDRMTPGAPPLWESASSQFLCEDTPSAHSPAAHSPAADSTEPSANWQEADARAELARYVTAGDNPLFWRSIANRLWLWTFGAPLVGSPNDFGRGGMRPTHPELLDYLAASLRDDPRHSLKSIIRLLVTSETYRRSSRVDPELAKRDANNAYLWRGNRRRLTAEEYRDSLLATSGLLDRTMGGKSFQDFVIEKPQHSPHYEYHLHDPADPTSHRRSVYRFVVRSQPQPLLTTLDCADPSISVPRRDESTTALQALAAWNNRLVEFTADKLGEKLETACDSPDEQIALACRLVLGRNPSPLEATVLKAHLNDHGPASLARVLFNMNAFVYLD